MSLPTFQLNYYTQVLTVMIGPDDTDCSSRKLDPCHIRRLFMCPSYTSTVSPRLVSGYLRSAVTLMQRPFVATMIKEPSNRPQLVLVTLPGN